MKKSVYLVIGAGIVGGLISADGESLLKPTSFPKTFNDVPFIARMEILADDYVNFETVYDDSTGQCISGCAYAGIKIEDETEAIERNTRRANAAIGAYIGANLPGADMPVSAPVTEQPIQPEQPTQPTSPSQSAQLTLPSQLVRPAQPTSTGNAPLNQTCMQYRVVRQTDIPWNSPIDGDIRITSDFGPRRAPKAGASQLHKGIDISVPVGTSVYATANGTVEAIRDQGNSGGGKYILLRHNNGSFHTAYFHLSKNDILKVGDRVDAGQLIGISGNTGNSTGAHLDYRVFYTQPNKTFNWDNDVIDPLWTKNYLDTQYRFKSQDVKSCLHNSHNFCATKSQNQLRPPETLPCEIK